MDLGVALLVVAVFLGAAALGVGGRRRGRAPFHDRWVSFAQRRNGTFLPGDTPDGPHMIHATREGVAYELRASAVADPDGEGRTAYTTVRAEALAPTPDFVEVRTASLASKLAEAVGAQDLVVGDEAFDRRFVVKAAHVESATSVLDEAARRRLLAIPHPLRFSYRAGVVELQWEGAEGDPRVLEAACELVVGCCQGPRAATYR